MGRIGFEAQRVRRHATQLLDVGRISTPPPWYGPMGTIPPSERLVRPAMQRPQKAGRRASKLFKPLHINYEEDRLRWEYFNDHPWELARPRVVLEDDGRDAEKWDWSVPLDHALHRPAGPWQEIHRWNKVQAEQCGRPINGEAVVKRNHHLIRVLGLPESTAYDTARKEFYRFRHAREIESRVAREEALSTGAFFGPGPNEIGMKLEDKVYDSWKVWAGKEIERQKQVANSAYTGNEAEENAQEGEGLETGLEEIEVAARGSEEGRGGAAMHP